jgi:hypothetical protein
MVDYKELLLKYILHISEIGGTDFIYEKDSAMTGCKSDFSEEELLALRKLSKEADELYYKN